MYPNTSSNAPAFQQGYVPYFYQIGLQYVYRTPQDWPRTERMVAYSAPGESSIGRAADRHPDHPQTVEQIIRRGYFAVPISDPTTAIITDKAQTSWLGLDDVISQVRRRYEIHERILYQIECSKSAAVNAIYQHEAYRGPGSADSKQHYAKHKEIQKLYEQQREEEVNLWKDVSRLRGLLPENAQMYLSAHRKLAVLKSIPGDEP